MNEPGFWRSIDVFYKCTLSDMRNESVRRRVLAGNCSHDLVCQRGTRERGRRAVAFLVSSFHRVEHVGHFTVMTHVRRTSPQSNTASWRGTALPFVIFTYTPCAN